MWCSKIPAALARTSCDVNVSMQAQKTIETQRAALSGLEKVQANAAQTKARMNLALKRLKFLEWEHEVLCQPPSTLYVGHLLH
jgi:hypothetical protein